MTKFKVGDRVKDISGNYPETVGVVGVIKGVADGDIYPWPNYVDFGIHSGVSDTEDFEGFNLYGLWVMGDSELELAE